MNSLVTYLEQTGLSLMSILGNLTYNFLELLPGLIGAIILLIDVLFQSMHIVPYLKISAFLTGLIFGLTVFVFFLSAVENHFLFNKTKILI